MFPGERWGPNLDATPNTEQGVYGDLVSYVDRKHFW